MAFSSEKFKNDRRFTTLDDGILSKIAVVAPALGRLLPSVEKHLAPVSFMEGALRTGNVFSGHSSSLLMERSLGMPEGSIAKTYKWPGKFAKMDAIQLDKEFAEYSRGALDYARVKGGDTKNMTPERQRLALTEGEKAFQRITALNDALVQMNPELEEARGNALKARQIPKGLKGEIYFAAGAMYRKHPDDISHFIKDQTGIMSEDMREHHRNVSAHVMEKAERFCPPDVSIGWIMSPSVAKRVTERLVEMERLGIQPKPRLYWAQQSVIPDTNRGLLSKMKRALGLSSPAPVIKNDAAQVGVGYNPNTPEPTTSVKIDKDLLNVAQVLGVKTEGFENTDIGKHLKSIRIETPSVEPILETTGSFDMS